ncbi:MAG: hypothetical protein JJU27_04240 [Gammaproteobacteria bacterium]|nr:hypothetical protein [Gammaproteobacteria bacterium]
MQRRRFLTTAGMLAAYTLSGRHVAAAEPQAAGPAGLLLGEGPQGHGDELTNGGAIVRWNAARQAWFMWYYGRDRSFPAGYAPALGTGSVLLATSPNGFAWERHAGPLPGGAIMVPGSAPDAFDSAHIGTSDVLLHEGLWYLFYFGGDHSTVEDPPRGYEAPGYLMRPGLAVSRDGLNWERRPGAGSGGALLDPGSDEVYAAFPSALHDGQQFILQYSTLRKDVFYWRTRHAVSEDGVKWEPLGELKWEQEPAGFETGGSNTRCVIANPRGDEPRWLMFYTALDARFPLYTRTIGVAGSDDGLRWRRLLDEPIFSIGSRDSWDGGGVSFPQVVARDGQLWMYYYGFADRGNTVGPQRGIGLAVSPDGDLRGFRRYRPTLLL